MAAAPPPPPKGGVITETITLTDTGDRKQMFGLEARHIKTVVVRKPGANACETKTITVETDGWYADLPEHASCPSAPTQTAPPPPPAGQQACIDRVETQQVGTAKLGFALSTDVITISEEGKDKDLTTMAVEVTDLKVTSLEPALFDVPPGYTEVKSYAELLPSHLERRQPRRRGVRIHHGRHEHRGPQESRRHPNRRRRSKQQEWPDDLDLDAAQQSGGQP